MHYTPHQYSRPLQFFAVISLMLFCALVFIGQMFAATVVALISFGIYVYGRLA